MMIRALRPVEMEVFTQLTERFAHEVLCHGVESHPRLARNLRMTNKRTIPNCWSVLIESSALQMLNVASLVCLATDSSDHILLMHKRPCNQ